MYSQSLIVSLSFQLWLVCCIFKKQKEFGESSDESSSESDSDSGSESDGGPSSSRGLGSGGHKDHDESCNHHHGHGHGSKKKAGKPKKRVLNEYERMPKGNNYITWNERKRLSIFADVFADVSSGGMDFFFTDMTYLL